VDISWGGQKNFCSGGAKAAKFHFTHSESEKTTFFCASFDVKMSNFKIHGGLSLPLPTPMATPLLIGLKERTCQPTNAVVRLWTTFCL